VSERLTSLKVRSRENISDSSVEKQKRWLGKAIVSVDGRQSGTRTETRRNRGKVRWPHERREEEVVGEKNTTNTKKTRQGLR